MIKSIIIIIWFNIIIILILMELMSIITFIILILIIKIIFLKVLYRIEIKNCKHFDNFNLTWIKDIKKDTVD